jgi:hypothetical protein
MTDKEPVGSILRVIILMKVDLARFGSVLEFLLQIARHTHY